VDHGCGNRQRHRVLGKSFDLRSAPVPNQVCLARAVVLFYKVLQYVGTNLKLPGTNPFLHGGLFGQGGTMAAAIARDMGSLGSPLICVRVYGLKIALGFWALGSGAAAIARDIGSLGSPLICVRVYGLRFVVWGLGHRQGHRVLGKSFDLL